MLLSNTSSGSSIAGRKRQLPRLDRHAARFRIWTALVWSLPGMRRATILILFILASWLFSVAQDKALISGDAEDKQDTPVSGVRVTLRNESLRIERTTTTNSDGLYFFAEVAPADGYVMTAQAPGMGFAPQSVKFEVEVGETRHILPSFIAEKSPAPVSNSRPPRRPDLPQPKGRPVAAASSSAHITWPTASSGHSPTSSAGKPATSSVARARSPLPVTYLSEREAPVDESPADGTTNSGVQDKTSGTAGTTSGSAP